MGENRKVRPLLTLGIATLGIATLGILCAKLRY